MPKSKNWGQDYMLNNKKEFKALQDFYWGQDYMLNNKKEFKALQDFYCGKQEEKKNTNKTPKKKKRK